MRFTFIGEAQETTVSYPSRVTYETEAESLDYLLEDITYFLRGCGYHIDELVHLREGEE